MGRWIATYRWKTVWPELSTASRSAEELRTNSIVSMQPDSTAHIRMVFPLSDKLHAGHRALLSSCCADGWKTNTPSYMHRRRRENRAARYLQSILYAATPVLYKRL